VAGPDLGRVDGADGFLAECGQIGLVLRRHLGRVRQLRLLDLMDHLARGLVVPFTQGRCHVAGIRRMVGRRPGVLGLPGPRHGDVQPARLAMEEVADLRLVG